MSLFINAPSVTPVKRFYSALELFLGGLLLIALGTLIPGLMISKSNWAAAAGVYGVIVFLTLTLWRAGPLGWANRVTLLRAVLVALVAGALADNAFVDAIWIWLCMAVVSLMLDGIDGFVARRTNSHSHFGARFDMELDALMILLLCIGLVRLESLGAWVVLIGVLRYAFVVAGWRLEWLAAPLFPSFRRKTVCVWQVLALLLSLTPLTSHTTAMLLALSALVASVYSFGVDIHWLYRQAQNSSSR